MTRKRFRKLCGGVCVAGFLLMLGTASASDCNTISLTRTLIQSCIGLALFAGGGTLGGIIEW